ncbi:MAG: iron-siderophore ABC transporter substrate-binding protein, partial [Actinomycetota bacterium]|nr:iron-siderophore ABC transporter substrate-binding protein [Actinomycetota bacterium]
GGPDDEGAAPDETTTTSVAEGDDAGDEGEAAAFPVEIEHKYGTTTIEAEPTRVVSVGYNDQDDLLALGVIPVGIRDWYGEQPYAVWPWAQDELGDAEPEVLSNAELNFEAIAALDPDLIIGVSSGMTEEDYALLDAIAPTVPQSGDYVDYGMPWQERALMIGRAVGLEAEAQALVDEVEGEFAAAREAHPEFDGATAAVAFVYNDLPGVYGSEDIRSRVMTDLGFVIPEEYDELAGDQFYVSISEEQTDLLDTDVLVWVGDAASLDLAQSLALRDNLTAVAEGREVFVGEPLGGAFSFASPLSLSYFLEQMVPKLAAAVDGDPATEVPAGADVDGADAGAADEADEEAAVELGPDEQAVADAYQTVFDSATTQEEKAAFLPAAAELAPTIEQYGAMAEGMGGIEMVVKAVTIDGATASVTYDVLIGGSAAYTDLEGTAVDEGGTWTVTRDEFCGFMSSARTPCS